MKFFYGLIALVSMLSRFGFAEDRKVISATSDQGAKLTLEFSTSKITKANKSALLCSDKNQKASSAKLWMPEHGHGSTPTKLVAKENSCTEIQKMNFMFGYFH